MKRDSRFSSSGRPNLWDLFLWKTRCYKDSPSVLKPHDFIYPAQPKDLESDLPTAVWMGHSTFLLDIDGVNILTDPIWEDYCSPIPMKAFKRQSKPPFPVSDLPSIDIVLISHNHYDHLDAKTVEALHHYHPHIEWVVPAGLSRWFHARGIHFVTEINWWDSHHGPKDTHITAVPSQHHSGRSLWDRNKSHWNGYVVEVRNKRIYFVGDTGYNDRDFKTIGKHWPHMDLSLIPIGAYIPSQFMKSVHVNPFEAVQIHQDVGSRLSVGMHWKTFLLSDEPIDRPPYDLYLAMKEKQLPFETFLPIDTGTYINF